jgi:hypothetical protein
VLSANFHTGALVVNYPYDSDPDPYAHYSATPDDDLFIAQSLTYSTLNGPMYNNPWFPQGITNGIAWYLVYGGMQDWNYVWMGCNEVTIELCNTSWPPYSQIPGLWDDNRDSMLAYMAWCLKGVRGLVTNSITGSPLAATVEVVGVDHEVYTDPDVGDYHRMLLPGTYSLSFSAEDFQTKMVTGVVVGSGDATLLDVALEPTGALTVSPHEISAAAGGTAEFTLMAGLENASRNYLLLGSASGTSPGFPLPGGLVTVPLNWDAFTHMVLNQLNTQLFSGFMESLDGSGHGAAHMNLTPLPHGAVGLTLYFAYILNAPFDFVSNPVEVEIIP